ncbi:MAG: UDP-glucose--hexose-1-phosphate uridylyltransferase [Propylenella sp.]
MSILQETSHRRLNPLTREWTLVSPHRTRRPWQGAIEKPAGPPPPSYDPDCYLCPGNRRAHDAINPRYAHTFVFDNDFPALEADAGGPTLDRDGLIVAEAEPGICRVVCFSPRHDLTLARMTIEDIGRVVDVWAEQSTALGAMEGISAVQVFENRGAMMGASNPHPHCQIWATKNLPNETVKELASQVDHKRRHGSCLLCDCIQLEREAGERIVFENEYFTVLVPFWAFWPFETMLVPRRHVGALDELTADERISLADALSRIATRYDNLFETSFPYSMGFHQKPTDGESHPAWHLHAHFYPPLLRSAKVRKFMVGFELLGTPQRDITAESAAARLREVSAVHYLDAAGSTGRRS